jgi:hypothetical protein
MNAKIILITIACHIIALTIIMFPTNKKSSFCLTHPIYNNLKYYIENGKVFILSSSSIIEVNHQDKATSPPYLLKYFKPDNCPADMNSFARISDGNYSKSLRDKVFETDLGD